MNTNYKFTPDINTGTLSSDDTKKYISRLAFAVLAFGVVSTAASLLLALGYGYVLSLLGMTADSLGIWADIIGNVLSLVAIYALGLPAYMIIAKPLPTVTPYREKMPLKKLFPGLCVSVLFMMIGSYISDIFITFFSNLRGNMLQNPVESMISKESVWITVIFMVIIGPILEEIVFRKLLCDKLLPLGEGYAIFLSAAVFGLMHGNFFQFAYAFLLGTLFALIYVKTGKLIYSTVYHMLINFSGSVVAPAIINMIDIDKLNEALNAGTIAPDDPNMPGLLALLAYEFVTMVLAVIGIVCFTRANRRRELTIDAGILPPPKKGKFANIFLNVGTAALIAYFAIDFLLSVVPVPPTK